MPTEGPVEIVENDDELEIGIAAGCWGAIMWDVDENGRALGCSGTATATGEIADADEIDAP